MHMSCFTNSLSISEAEVSQSPFKIGLFWEEKSNIFSFEPI